MSQARRIALGAQGFNRPRPTGRIDRRHLRRVLDDVGLIQIDSVNVLVRSQELPLFARLGPHPRRLIPDAAAAGELFETWVHEACHVPTAHHHLYRWRMRNPRYGAALDRLDAQRPGFVDEVKRFVADRGPVAVGDVRSGRHEAGGWWNWDDTKLALEGLFARGELAATRRSSDFARLYDLAERTLPAAALETPEPPEAEARKTLIEHAARYYGVATDSDLADYHRQRVTDCRPLIAELVEDGRLLAAAVEGWSEPAYLHPEATLPRSIDAVALLSPFDPVCWYRPRAERLWDFHYRIEIYTPREQRRYGYYVLPVLIGECLVGRVDLKADRARGVLVVQAAWVEPGVAPGDVGPPLSDELHAMASWLQLDRVTWAGHGNLR